MKPFQELPPVSVRAIREDDYVPRFFQGTREGLQAAIDYVSVPTKASTKAKLLELADAMEDHAWDGVKSVDDFAAELRTICESL